MSSCDQPMNRFPVNGRFYLSQVYLKDCKENIRSLLKLALISPHFLPDLRSEHLKHGSQLNATAHWHVVSVLSKSYGGSHLDNRGENPMSYGQSYFEFLKLKRQMVALGGYEPLLGMFNPGQVNWKWKGSHNSILFQVFRIHLWNKTYNNPSCEILSSPSTTLLSFLISKSHPAQNERGEQGAREWQVIVVVHWYEFKQALTSIKWVKKKKKSTGDGVEILHFKMFMEISKEPCVC